MATVTSTIDVNAPISTVYNQWTQFEEFPTFMSGVESVVQKTDTLTAWTVSIAGIEREFDAEIVEQHPDERVAWKSVSGEQHSGVVTFHRLDDAQTRVQLQLTWTPEGIVEKVGALLQVDDIQTDLDLHRFKEIVEANGVETGAWRGDIDRAPDSTGR